MLLPVMKKSFLVLVLLMICAGFSLSGELNKQEVNEDDFDEFEFDFEEEEESDEGEAGTTEDDSEEGDFDGDESDEDSEQEEFDTEEFEGEPVDESKKPSSDKLEILESTVEMKSFWEAYFIEVCIVLLGALYFTNYLLGRSKNTQIAETWAKVNMDVLRNNFEIVGDDGEGEEPSEAHVVRRSDSSFVVWASGRINCDGLLVHLDLTKRHDLISILYGLFKPEPDTLSFIFQLGEADMDSIVCAVSSRKTIAKVQKDYEDLNNFCSTPRSADKHGLPNTFSVLSETYDTASAVLSGSTSNFLSKRSDLLISIHVSDQYTGLKEDDSEDKDKVVVKKPEKRIHLTFKLPSKCEESLELLQFALRFLDHVKGIKLSREAKDKTSKNRQRVVQNQEKLQHQARQEAAQQRKEEKRKADKDKLLHETDPEKARKLEEKEHKKQMKKSGPKMKQMKVRMG